MFLKTIFCTGMPSWHFNHLFRTSLSFEPHFEASKHWLLSTRTNRASVATRSKNTRENSRKQNTRENQKTRVNGDHLARGNLRTSHQPRTLEKTKQARYLLRRLLKGIVQVNCLGFTALCFTSLSLSIFRPKAKKPREFHYFGTLNCRSLKNFTTPAPRIDET